MKYVRCNSGVESRFTRLLKRVLGRDTEILGHKTQTALSYGNLPLAKKYLNKIESININIAMRQKIRLLEVAIAKRDKTAMTFLVENISLRGDEFALNSMKRAILQALDYGHYDMISESLLYKIESLGGRNSKFAQDVRQAIAAKEARYKTLVVKILSDPISDLSLEEFDELSRLAPLISNNPKNARAAIIETGRRHFEIKRSLLLDKQRSAGLNGTEVGELITLTARFETMKINELPPSSIKNLTHMPSPSSGVAFSAACLSVQCYLSSAKLTKCKIEDRHAEGIAKLIVKKAQENTPGITQEKLVDQCLSWLESPSAELYWLLFEVDNLAGSEEEKRILVGIVNHLLGETHKTVYLG